MAHLPEDSAIRSQILPSIWAGYTLPRSVIMGEKLPFTDMISTQENIPQDWLDDMMNVFQNGTLSDFYDKYLSHSLTQQNCEEILLEANKILKENIRELTPPKNPLIAITGADVAHNALEYGHHLFQTACFLKEHKQLPKECEFMFWRKINPAFYEEKELFETVQRALSEPMCKIPQKWTEEAFYHWTRTDDSNLYLSQMKKMAGLEFVLANGGQMPIDCALDDYLRDHRISAHHNRPRPRRLGGRHYAS